MPIKLSESFTNLIWSFKMTNFKLTFFPPIIEHQLIDWVEHHRMVGVDKMVIYNFTKDNPAMEDHLRHYQKLGIVDVLQWKIPKGRYYWLFRPVQFSHPMSGTEQFYLRTCSLCPKQVTLTCLVISQLLVDPLQRMTCQFVSIFNAESIDFVSI